MAAWGTTRFAVRPGGRGAAAYLNGSMTHGGPRQLSNRPNGAHPGMGDDLDGLCIASPATLSYGDEKVGSTSAGTRSSEEPGTLSSASDSSASCGARQAIAARIA